MTTKKLMSSRMVWVALFLGMLLEKAWCCEGAESASYACTRESACIRVGHEPQQGDILECHQYKIYVPKEVNLGPK